MRVRNGKDFAAGLTLLAAGIAFAAAATGYRMGSAANMGPGYLPFVLGGILGALGLAVAASALAWRRLAAADTNPVGPFAWRAIACVLGGNLVFGIAVGGLPALNVPPLGLIVATLLLVTIVSAAEPGFAWGRRLALAAGLAGLSYVVFVRIVGLQIDVLPRLSI